MRRPCSRSTGRRFLTLATSEQLPLIDCDFTMPSEPFAERALWATPSATMGDRGGRGDLIQQIRGNPSPSGRFRSPTSSAAASPARTSATQASAQASTASGQDYGQSTPELLASYDRDTSSWRTSQLCLDGELSEFSETWPRSGLMRSGIAYRLPPLVRLTDATECGSSPNPTPSVCGNYNRKGASPTSGDGLATYARMWPTPTAITDSGGAALCKWGGSGSRAKLRTMVPPEEPNGALNPTWVEWLMGFPLEWTALDASEMPSSRRSRKSSDAQS
jgi:hypothetical protein